VRTDLCAEAIRLGRLVRLLMAPQPPPEATALLALMLLHDSRREARRDGPATWSCSKIRTGAAGSSAHRGGAAARRGGAARRSRTLRAAGRDRGAALSGGARGRHGLAADRAPLRSARAPAALAGRVPESRGGGGDGRRRAGGLALIDALAAAGDLGRYHLLHAARADLLRRLGSWKEAAAGYEAALALVTNEAERRFLERRLGEVRGRSRASR